MKVLSLFNGISCGRVALERAGLKVDRYVSYEIDDYANKVAKKNYPNDEYCGDVTTADFYQYQNFDLLIGGSPCTYWSIARNKLAEHKRETTNNGLGWELFMQYKRALIESNCKYFLYENNFSISKDIKEYISHELGVNYIIINSDLVSAQNRKRCYWTNILNIIQPNNKNILLKDILEKERKDWRNIGNWVYGDYYGKTKLEVLKTICSDKSHTLTTCKGHPQNYICNENKTMYSNLTINEYEKLQTLPVDYTRGISESQRYKCVGNGWTVDIIAHIFSFLPNEYKEVNNAN